MHPFQSPSLDKPKSHPLPKPQEERGLNTLPPTPQLLISKFSVIPVPTSPSTCPKVSENNHGQQ